MDVKQNMQMFLSQEHFKELEVLFNAEERAIWCRLWPTSHPCCTSELFTEMHQILHGIDAHAKLEPDTQRGDVLRYLIIASRIPGIFSLGGDLALFIRLIRSADREGLYRYAKSSIDLAHMSYHLPATIIALVQGDALGGGFEAALVSRVIIAERQARMGLPDVLFNLFPICAYSLLARRLDPVRAEQIILSGRVYSAEELHEMGVVDVLVETGEGEKAVRDYMKKQNRANRSYQAVHSLRQIHRPMSYDELLRIATIWVDNALRLNERDLRVMERFAKSQEKLVVLRPPAEVKQLA